MAAMAVVCGRCGAPEFSDVYLVSNKMWVISVNRILKESISNLIGRKIKRV
jgi:heterodisulfide reductase subunit B